MSTIKFFPMPKKKTKAKPKKTSQPKSAPKKEVVQKRNPAKLALIIIGISIAVLFSLFFVAMRTDEGTAGEANDTSIFIPFVPVWIAVFIPLFAKKNGPKLSENVKKTLMVLVIATLILVLITFLILLS